MKNSLAIGFFALVIFGSVGCTTVKVSDFQRWASVPTPSVWKVGSTWALVLLDKDGSIYRTLTVRISNERAESCLAGDWKVLEILEERPKLHDKIPPTAAYLLEGSALMIELEPGFCDAYYLMYGHLTELGVSGTHGWQAMYDAETVGLYYGAPVNG